MEAKPRRQLLPDHSQPAMAHWLAKGCQVLWESYWRVAVRAGLIIRYISVSDQHKQETIHVPIWNKKTMWSPKVKATQTMYLKHSLIALYLWNNLKYMILLFLFGFNLLNKGNYLYSYIYICVCVCVCIYTGAGHIIRISSKSWFISLIPFKKWNLYNVYIHSTQTDIFQVFISFNFDDYKWQLMKTPNSVSQKIRILWKGSILKTPGATL